jgi:hypothetical protein
MRGGGGELAVPVCRQVSPVGEVYGERKNNLPANPGNGLSLSHGDGRGTPNALVR